MPKETNSHIEEFKNFLKEDIGDASGIVEGISPDKKRIHITKLIFASAVDRFDHLIDKILLDRVEISPILQEELLQKHEKETLSEKQLYEIFLSDEDPKQRVLENLKNTLRTNVLRKRHSTKLKKLFESLDINPKIYQTSRVNPNKGVITEQFKKQDKSIPTSVIGYADWIYCRRNAIVHGGRSLNLAKYDIDFLEKEYKVKGSAVRVKIRKGSLSNIQNFYTDLIEKILIEKIDKISDS